MAAALLLVAGCSTGGDIPEPTVGADSEGTLGRVVFDMGHGEIFGATDTSELGQSTVVERIEAAGFDVQVSTEPLSDELLEGAAGLILAGPMTALTVPESDALDAYIRDGGTVVLTLHVPFPVMSLPARFGLPVTTGVLRSEDAADPEDSGVFVARDIAEDEITAGVEGVLVLSGWGIEAASQEASVVVASGTESWVDIDGDGVRTDADPSGPFGVVGVARVGAGTAVVVGDDGVFANVGIGAEDNARLLDNIIALMLRSGRST